MSDDLAPLFDPRPDRPSQDVRFRQGVILTFDRNTLENTVSVGGSVLSNLPLLGVGEVTTLVAGSVVGIMAVGEAAKSMFITGRIVTPNTDDATDAVSLLNSQIASDQVFANENCASTTFTDLTTVGPRVTVNVGPNGRLLIIATAQLGWSTTAAGTIQMRGDLGVDLTGANVHAPDIVVDPLLPLDAETWVVSAGTIGNSNARTITGQAVLTGLNAGNTTLKLMYRKSTVVGAFDCQFARRTITVVKL
jgi:hypothetical protein